VSEADCVPQFVGDHIARDVRQGHRVGANGSDSDQSFPDRPVPRERDELGFRQDNDDVARDGSQPLGKRRVRSVEGAVVQCHNQIVRKAPFLPGNRAQSEARAELAEGLIPERDGVRRFRHQAHRIRSPTCQDRTGPGH
jgi:hypothetical protein